MANDAIALHALIKRFRARADEQAHKVMNAGLDFEGYLIGVGRYREMKASIDFLEKLMRARPVDDIDDDSMPEDQQLGPEDEQPDDNEPEPPRKTLRRTPARRWQVGR